MILFSISYFKHMFWVLKRVNFNLFLYQVIPLHQRDVLFCLHENGSITCRVRRRNNSLMASYHEGIGGFGKLSVIGQANNVLKALCKFNL